MTGRLISAACHPPHPVPLPLEGDLLLVSPVFDPISKRFERPAIGIDRFHACAASTTIPCFALGGVTAARIPQMKPLAGVAVIGEVMHSDSPAHAAEALLRALE